MLQKKKAASSFDLNEPVLLYSLSGNQEPGKVLEVNPAACQLLGYSEDELLRLNPLDLIETDTRDRFRKMHRNMLNGCRITSELRLRSKNGTLIPAELNLYTLESSGNQFISCIARDLTEKHALKESLSHKDRLLESVAESMHILLGCADFEPAVKRALSVLGKGTEVDRVYVFENHRDPSTRDLLTSQRFEWCSSGATPQMDNRELQNVPFDRMFPRWIEEMVQGRPVSGRVKDFPVSEREILEPQGIVSILATPVFQEGNFWGFLGFDDCRRDRRWTDHEKAILSTVAGGIGSAMERERKGEALQLKEQEYRALVENAPDLIARIDRSLRCLYINPAAEQLFGKPPESFIGKRIDEIGLSPRLCNEIQAAMQDVLMTDRDVTLDSHFQPAKGATKHFQVRMVPERTRRGEINSILLISRDITDQKVLEAELRKANQAKSEFLANMSHEIRTPLSGILGIVDLILQRELTENMREELGMIKDSAGSLTQIINDILDLSRIEAGKFQLFQDDFNLRETVERILRGFAVQASAKEISLLWEIDPDVPDLLHGDHVRLGQILKNLVANAIKFTDEGQVRVRIKAVEKHPGQATISFAVQDTGIGIPRMEQEKLFQSFTQLDPTYSKRYGGAGLGLIISKQLAQYMDGNIVVESEPGRGSTFTLTASFPLAKHLSDSQTTHQRSQPLTAPMRILLAEDNMVNQAFLSRYLQHQGHQVTPVENGLKVLELLQKDAFDLILMDVQMPGMDGVEATKRIRTGQAGSDQDIPIIALTAYAMKGDKERFLQAGMTDYISKPVDFDLLRNKMQRFAGDDKKIRN